MAKKKLSIDKSVTEMERKFKEHIGSNGDSHLPVTEDAPGFVPVEMFKQHQQLFHQRVRITKSGTDILTLEPGYYEGSQLINHPATTNPQDKTTWISNIDVIPGGDGRKFIQITDNVTGYRWYRTVHTGGDVSSGTGAWVKSEGYEILWSGNSTLADPVKLASPLTDSTGTSRYDGILVDYETTSSQHNRCYGSRYSVKINTTNVNDTGVTADFLEGKIEFPTNQTAQMTENVTINLYQHTGTDNTAYMQRRDGEIKILRISGLK
ncbi:hypothetical protein [Pediococcus acidilactici]|uniref:hypothetical protein n=1 Tax=Pediococcus acidilactici TaxID=1254 RepID=UPI0020744B81|nr:hypothetical protein [Pediococcus acidilactici]